MPDYVCSVFINCPFDGGYDAMFKAIVFTVLDCGYVPRCALQKQDSSDIRLSKITELIRECALGIHDLSRAGADAHTGLARFNMPFELGIFWGAMAFGGPPHHTKKYLIMDTEPYRYQKFISDLAGQDIRTHNSRPLQGIRVIRDWLSSQEPGAMFRSYRSLQQRYQRFLKELRVCAKTLQFRIPELNFNDFSALVISWLEQNP